MRTLIRTLQEAFEELAYFSSSSEAVKPSGGTTALFGKSGQLVRREVLTSDQSHPTSGTLANLMQHAVFVPEDIRMVCELQKCIRSLSAPAWAASNPSHIVPGGGGSWTAGPRRQISQHLMSHESPLLCSSWGWATKWRLQDKLKHLN